MLLVLLGNTRTKGDRRRAVQKAAEWLWQQQLQRPSLWALLALEALDEKEKSGNLPPCDWFVHINKTPEGKLLEQFLHLDAER